jgi:CubicO group peptidase (beta-lactamase class C family)
MKRKIILLSFTLFLFHQNSKAQKLYFPPLSFTANWDTTSPITLGWCLPKIDSLYRFLEQQNTKGFMVLKDGKIVLEKYFGTFTKDSVWYWASAGKTVTSFLIGKAKEENLLKLTDTSSKYLGNGWTDCTLNQENKITILSQLSMTSGLDDGVVDNHCTDKLCLKYKADARTRWAYHNAPYTLLEKVIINATSNTINNYTAKNLSVKTGINGFWLTSNFNNVYYSKLRHMARFGLLYQNNCIWNTDTLLYDTSYINQSTNTSQYLNFSYGYLWWLNGKQSYMVPTLQTVFPGSFAPNAPIDMYAALGKNGQILCVSKSKGLVVVRMGDAPGSFGEVPTVFCDQMWLKLNEVMCNSTSITNVPNETSKVLFFPNPFDDEITLNFNTIKTKPIKLTINDAIGKVVYFKNIQNVIGENTIIINEMIGLKSGIYFAQLTDENGFNETIKLIKK